MALGTRKNNTMQEALQEMLQNVAYMQSFPDADLDFLTNLQQQILAKLRAPVEQYMAQAQQSMGGGAAPVGPPPGGGMGGGGDLASQMAGMMGGGGPAGPPPGPPAGLPAGLRNGGGVPPVDELRRLLGAGGQ